MSGLSITETFPSVLGVTHKGTLTPQSAEAYTALSNLSEEQRKLQVYLAHVYALEKGLEPDTTLAFERQGTGQHYHYTYTAETSCRASS